MSFRTASNGPAAVVLHAPPRRQHVFFPRYYSVLACVLPRIHNLFHSFRTFLNTSVHLSGELEYSSRRSPISSTPKVLPLNAPTAVRKTPGSGSMDSKPNSPQRALSLEFDSAPLPSRRLRTPSRSHVVFTGVSRVSHSASAFRCRAQGPQRHPRPLPQGALHAARRNP